jgi:Arc/MetJ-type ribon-helix-helix transcriptional regulator
MGGGHLYGPKVYHHTCYHDDMERTTISIPEPLLRRLRVVAAERGTSMAELIREAVEEKVAAHRPRPRSLGIGASGHRGTARETADERPEPRSWR